MNAATRRELLGQTALAAGVIALPAGGAMALPGMVAHPTPIEALYGQWLEAQQRVFFEVNRWAVDEDEEQTGSIEACGRGWAALYVIGNQIAEAPVISIEDIVIKLQLMQAEFEYISIEAGDGDCESVVFSSTATLLAHFRGLVAASVPPVPAYVNLLASEILGELACPPPHAISTSRRIGQ